MAKVKKNFKFNRTIDGVTYVNSKSYQPHVRAERGTYTPVSLADGMKKSAVEQTQASLMAKIVFDAVNKFAPNFKDGKFWSRLVSRFRFLVKERKGYELLDGMEVRPDYPMSRQGNFVLEHKPETIILCYRATIGTRYRLSILRIGTDQEMLVPYPDEVIVIETSEEEWEGEVTLNFTPLADEAQKLYIIKSEQLINGKVEGLLSQKSVTFLRCS
jgi:hypothetical protein